MPAKDITDVVVWNSVADDFALGLVSTVVHWSPNILVIGGGIGCSEKLPFERLVSRVAVLQTAFTTPEIKRAALGDEAGLYGALAHLKAVGVAV
jgi:predicted NBD/HSP70 family sugar kinase